MSEEVLTLAPRAPDPESLGKIRHVVSTAHKWGGDGHEPKFRKIRQVLLRKHPEVIARAFGGNANVAAAWIKNNWYRMRGMNPPATRGKGAKVHMSLDNQFQEVPREFFSGGHELFSAGYDPEREGDLIWVTAMREGEWKVNPIPRQRGPLVLDRPFMEDVLRAWREGAWEFVTVPTYHTDQDVLANTGYVRELRITSDPTRPGKSLLRAALEFTEPDVAEKVLRGSIAGVSVNVKFGVRHQETGKMYSRVLTHIALTNVPFINGLRAFERRLAASADAVPGDDEVLVSYQLADDDDVTWLALADAWDPEKDMGYVRQQIDAQLNHYGLDHEGDLYDMSVDSVHEGDATPASVFVMGMTSENVLLCAHAAGGEDVPMMHVGDMNGDCVGWVAGYSMDDSGEVVMDPLDEWVAVRKAWVELSREYTLVHGLPITGEVTTVAETNELALHALEERVALLETTPTSPRGGDGMADGNDNQEQETTTTTTEASSSEEQVTLSREDLDRIADERAQVALTAYRQEQEEQQNARDEELAATRRQLHEMTVRERVAEMEEAGHAPAVVRVAREIMLADVRQEPVLSLSREDGEISLSATAIVTEILGALPDTAFTKNDIVVGAGGNGKPDEDDIKARADRIIEFVAGE